MFNVNNKVLDKEGNEGFISHVIGDVYVVNVQNGNSLTVHVYRSPEIYLKECPLGMNNSCDNVSPVLNCEHCKIMKELGEEL